MNIDNKYLIISLFYPLISLIFYFLKGHIL